MKVYDYINRVDKRFRFAIFKGMKIHSPSRCYAVVLTELSLKARLDQSSRDVIELNVC